MSIAKIYDTPVRCVVEKGVYEEGKRGLFYGWIQIDGTTWGIVKWEEDDDPDFYKAHYLLIEETKMVRLNLPE